MQTKARAARWGVLVALVAGVCEAQAQEPVPAVVLAGPIEGALVRRIRGQLADTPWSVRERDAGEAFGVEQARAVADGARAVVWARRTDEGFEIAIADVAGRRLLVRELEGRFTESTLLETVAAWVRATLEALRMGAEIGVQVPPAEPAPSPTPSPIDDVLEPPTPPRLENVGEDPYPRGSVAADLALDAPGVLGAGALEIGLGWQRVHASIGGGFGAPATQTEARFGVELVRYRVEAAFGLNLLDDDVFALIVEARAGLELVRRVTVDALAPLSAEPPEWHPLFVVSGLSRLEAWPLREFGVAIAIGVDVLPWALRWDLREEGVASAAGGLWNVRPRGQIALVWAVR